jgi:aminoglycoside/choline kinase family phosphotransferase
MKGASHSCIGAIAMDVRENEAFFCYTRHLHAKGMSVPELYAVSDDRCRYLQQDLGDQTLYGLLYEKKRQGRGFDEELMALYRQVLADLAAIQDAGADMDFSVAYPRAAFDSRSIHWDLNYFKYFFLKLNHIDFDEELLENDFDDLTDRLLSADCHYFLYRDFNPRNIMVTNPPSPVGEGSGVRLLYYIDYQGGRRGAAQYDVASLLYSAKSDIPEALRIDLLNHYLSTRGLTGEARKQWLDHFWMYLLVRILQTLGAYGYRGLYERKPYFIESIPLALNNLRLLLQDHPDLLANLPELRNDVDALNVSTCQPINLSTDTLTVTVQSFSYKQGLPDDPSGNGGGHIFDCRALPNPGRYPEYKTYTGKDRPVIEFLQREPAVDLFLQNAMSIVTQSVDKYLERHFANLSVAFGCTGGQHRSVYCAEQLAARLKEKYPAVNVVIKHREQA